MSRFYASPADDIAARQGLSDDLRKLLLAIPKEEWRGHPNYWRGADFWKGVHRTILSESGAFANGLQELSDLSADELERGLFVSELRHFGRHLLDRVLLSETADRDTVGRALDDARALDRLLNRHIADEEDIVIPVLLQD